jgi:hypothetical protein
LGAFFDLVEEFVSVNRVDHRGEVCRWFGLVALERTDEMPADIWQVGEFGGFVDQFLDVVFTEVALARGVRDANGFGGFGFGHGDESHGVLGSTCAVYGVVNECAYSGETFGDGFEVAHGLTLPHGWRCST